MKGGSLKMVIFIPSITLASHPPESRGQAELFLRKFNFILSKWLVPATKGGSSRCISTVERVACREVFQDIMATVFN